MLLTPQTQIPERWYFSCLRSIFPGCLWTLILSVQTPPASVLSVAEYYIVNKRPKANWPFLLSLPWLCESYGFTKKTWLPLQFQAGLAIGSACNTHRFPRRSSARKIMVRSCWILADSRSKLGLTRCKKSNFFYRGIPIDPSGEQSMSRMPRMSRCCCVVNTMCLRSSEAQDKICSIFFTWKPSASAAGTCFGGEILPWSSAQNFCAEEATLARYASWMPATLALIFVSVFLEHSEQDHKDQR